MATLPVKKGIWAPVITNIPASWDREWFRSFVTNFLVNMDLRNSITTGNTTINTQTTVTSSATLFTTTASGTVPAPGAGSTRYLDSTGSWSTPAGGGGGGVAGSNTQVQFNNSGAFGASANFTWNGSTLAVVGAVQGTTLNATSDPSLKKNIKKVENSGHIVDQLNGYHFEWKESSKPSIGVMSDEVLKVAPSLVTRVNNHDAVNYNGLIAVLLEEVKALRARVSDLESKLGK